MKQIFLLFLVTISFSFLITPKLSAQKDPKISFEDIRQKCKSKPFDQRVRLSVARFSVSTPSANGQFGEELSTMLTNALQQTSCFRVLESIKNAEDMTGEIAFGASGMTNAGSSPQGGQMMGAQVVVTGEVTEYNDGKNNVALAGLSIGADKARIGFIIKLINPQTRDVLFSRSINVLGKKSGFNGMKIFGINAVGSNSQNRAVADAVEKGILEAVSVIVDNMDNIPLPGANSGKSESISYNKSNCSLLASSNPPSVMVIIPEIHIQRKIPDPAGETEIIRKLIEAGFRVIDPSVYDNIRDSYTVQSAAKDATQARSLGLEYGADIIIIGEAFSERAANQGNMISCRARVEARAVSTKDAMILAAHGTHAGGADITESSSSKISLANAGSLMADYLLGQFCKGGSNQANSNFSAKGGNNSTSIEISKVDFNSFKSIQNALESSTLVSQVTKSFTGKDASFRVNHSGSTDDILDILMGVNSAFEVKSYADGKLILSGK